MNHPKEQAKGASSSSTTCCRAAMALNNLAISTIMTMMMEQDQTALQRAICLFKESFAAMASRHLIPSGGEFEDIYLAPVVSHQEHQQEQPAPSSASAIITSRYQMMTQQTNNTMQVPAMMHPWEICPCDDDDLSFQTSALPHISKFVPILLRSLHFYDDQEHEGGGSTCHETNAHLALAIIMYNHGLARLLAHLQDKKRSTSSSTMGCGCGSTAVLQTCNNTLLHGAVVALHCSQVLIDRHLDAVDNRQPFDKLSGLVVSAMTLKTMMWTSRLYNQDPEASAQVGARFSHVLAEMDRYQEQLRHLSGNLMCQTPFTSTAA